MEPSKEEVWEMLRSCAHRIAPQSNLLAPTVGLSRKPYRFEFITLLCLDCGEVLYDPRETDEWRSEFVSEDDLKTHMIYLDQELKTKWRRK